MKLEETKTLLSAIAFAADKHRFQKRKDTAGTPYINHPIQVADACFKSIRPRFIIGEEIQKIIGRNRKVDNMKRRIGLQTMAIFILGIERKILLPAKYAKNAKSIQFIFAPFVHFVAIFYKSPIACKSAIGSSNEQEPKEIMFCWRKRVSWRMFRK